MRVLFHTVMMVMKTVERMIPGRKKACTVPGVMKKVHRKIPGRKKTSTVKMLHDGEADRVLDYMRSISPSVNIDGDGYITAK